jgi:ABC-type cobalamin/Fe3+-siderophores transport system ATPase subunit
MSRQCIFWIIVGTNGVGKTTFAKDIIEKKYPKDRSVLIADPDGYEPAWHKYPSIDVGNIQHMTNHRFRFMSPEKEDLEEFRKFKNGMLVLDDCNHYLKANLQTEMKQIFIRRRQNDVDIIAMAHHLTEVPPKFWNFASHLVLFKTGPLRRSANIPMFIKDEGHIAEVNNHPDRHYKKIIKLRG